MLMTVVLFVIGLLLIMFGGDRFVDAAVEISRKLGIPQLVVGCHHRQPGNDAAGDPRIHHSSAAGSSDIAAGNAFGPSSVIPL